MKRKANDSTAVKAASSEKKKRNDKNHKASPSDSEKSPHVKKTGNQIIPDPAPPSSADSKKVHRPRLKSPSDSRRSSNANDLALSPTASPQKKKPNESSPTPTRTGSSPVKSPMDSPKKVLNSIMEDESPNQVEVFVHRFRSPKS